MLILLFCTDYFSVPLKRVISLTVSSRFVSRESNHYIIGCFSALVRFQTLKTRLYSNLFIFLTFSIYHTIQVY